MEKGHYGEYTGNARHSRKEEMIHDRELIYDAKKQLHKADQDYKHDTPAKMYGKKKDSPAKMYKDSPVNGNAFTKAMADSGGDYDKAKQMLDSPATMYGKKEGSPAKNSGLGPKTAGSGMYMRACGYKK